LYFYSFIHPKVLIKIKYRGDTTILHRVSKDHFHFAEMENRKCVDLPFRWSRREKTEYIHDCVTKSVIS